MPSFLVVFTEKCRFDGRIIPSVGVDGHGRFTMGLRRLESVPHQPGFLIVLRP